jgi:hypothetical protein
MSRTDFGYLRAMCLQYLKGEGNRPSPAQMAEAVLLMDDERQRLLHRTPAAPQWTKTPPTQAGWYWAKQGGRIEVVEAFENVREVACVGYGPALVPTSQFDLWAGPISPPPLPEAKEGLEEGITFKVRR